MTLANRRTFLKHSAGAGLALWTSSFGFLGSVTSAHSEIKKVVKVGVANELPYSFLDSKGVLTGQSVDVLNACLEGSGIEKMEGVLTEFAALIPGLVAKRFDIVCTGMFIRPARCQQIAFGNPDSMGRVGAIVPVGNPKKISGFDDFLKNPDLKLAYIRGSIVDTYAKAAKVPEAQLLVLPDFTTLVAAIKGGRAHAAFGGWLILNATLQKVNEPSLQMAEGFVDVIINGKPVIDYAAMGFRKGDTDLLATYNAGLTKIIKSGKLLEINAKWGIPAGLTATADTASPAQICQG
jgi:polar amino acid transport system substrate-binding protein